MPLTASTITVGRKKMERFVFESSADRCCTFRGVLRFSFGTRISVRRHLD